MGHHGHSDHNNTALSFFDVIAGGFSFLLVAYFMRWLINNGVPGLLKEDTFIQILQAGILFLLVWGLFLNNLFKEYLKVLELREERSIGAEAEAVKLKLQAKELEVKLEQELQNARIAALAESERITSQARKNATDLLEEAARIVDQKYANAQLQIEEIQMKANSELSQEAIKLAQHFKECALKPSGQTIH